MEGQVSAGHPVDIGSGILWTECLDFKFRGRFPMQWERRYSTGLLSNSPTQFGPGWTCPFFAKLTRAGTDWHFRNSEGALVVIPDPDDAVNHGKVVRNLGSYCEIAKDGFFLRVTKWNSVSGEVIRSTFKPGINGQWWALLSLDNPAGDGLELSWDDQGRLKGIRQKKERRTVSVDHRADGRIVSLSLAHADGRRTPLARFDYDSKGRLSTAFDANGFAERYEYDDNNRMSREIGKDGAVFNFRYDDKGRCIRAVGPGGYDLKAFRFLDVADLTEVTNSLGHTTRYKRLPSGQISEILYPSGGISKTEYDLHGRITKEENAVGAITAYEYNDQGDRCKTIDPLGNVTKFEFTEWHETLSMEDAGGNKWSREFDANRRRVKMIDPLDNTWKIEYDAAGNPIKVINPAGNEQLGTFSPLGVLQEATDWMGNRSRYVFDDFGRVIERVGPLGGSTRIRYDAMGRVVGSQYEDGTGIQAQYDASGNMTKYTGRNGESTLFRYGFCGRLLEKKDRNGNTLKYDWSTEPQQLLAIHNRIGESFRFAYDPEKRLIMEKGFDGTEMHFKYDAAGNLVRVTNSEGQIIQFKNNPTGRTVECIQPEGLTTYKYDYRNRVIESVNPEITVRSERDALGRVIKEQQGAHGWERTFDPMGRILTLKSDLGADFAFEYDPNGNMTAMDIPGDGRTTFSRNSQGLILSQSMPEGFVLKQEYDGLGRLLRQQGGGKADNMGLPGPGDIDSAIGREFSYGSQGELLAMRDQRWGNVRYSYDKMDNLANAIWDSGPRESFFHDVEGRLLRISENGDERLASYLTGGRLSRFGDMEYAFDGTGRMIRKGRAGEVSEFTFAWDSGERLTGFTDPHGNAWTYGYDAAGSRVRKEGKGKKLGYIWHADLILHEYDGETTTTFIHDIALRKPLAMVKGDQVGYLICDHLETPREMVDRRGKLLWAARYRAYGALSDKTGTGMECPLRFKGQWFDPESGLHYNQLRYYDPETGRYISPDPIRLYGGMDPYGYTTNPINFSDPQGLADEHQLGTFSELSSTSGGDPNANHGDQLDAHEMIRNKYLSSRGRTPANKRHPDNPSIALTRDQHNDVHRHEIDVREERGLGPKQFAKTYCEEISIMSEAMKRAGVPQDKIDELAESAKKFAGVGKCK